MDEREISRTMLTVAFFGIIIALMVIACMSFSAQMRLRFIGLYAMAKRAIRAPTA